VKFIDIGLLDRLLHEMVKMSPLQGSRFELVPTSDEWASSAPPSTPTAPRKTRLLLKKGIFRVHRRRKSLSWLEPIQEQVSR